MNQAIKEKWLKALRSGKYQQAHRELRNTAGAMCCLGVLCDLIDPSRWNENRSFDAANGEESAGFGYAPSDIIFDIAEFPEVYLETPIDGVKRAPDRVLAALNDNGYTFAEIADYIEQNL